jgi:hypothetical protein
MCSHLGIIFTEQGYHDIDDPMPVPNFAHVYTEEIVSDTSDWISISGSFVADQHYTHMAIGVFFEFDSLNVLQILPGSGLGSYYYIDDICVSPYPDCEKVSVSSETRIQPELSMFPNPAKNFITVKSPWHIEAIRLIDFKGIEVLVNKPNLSEFKLDISSLTTGVYIVEVTTIDKKTRRERLVVVH